MPSISENPFVDIYPSQTWEQEIYCLYMIGLKFPLPELGHLDIWWLYFHSFRPVGFSHSFVYFSCFLKAPLSYHSSNIKAVCVRNACRLQLRSNCVLVFSSVCAYLVNWWGSLSKSPLAWRLEAPLRELMGKEKAKQDWILKPWLSGRRDDTNLKRSIIQTYLI